MTQGSLERLSSLANNASRWKRLKFSQSLSKSTPFQSCDRKYSWKQNRNWKRFGITSIAGGSFGLSTQSALIGCCANCSRPYRSSQSGNLNIPSITTFMSKTITFPETLGRSSAYSRRFESSLWDEYLIHLVIRWIIVIWCLSSVWMRIAEFRKCDSIIHSHKSSLSDIRTVSIRDRGEFTFLWFHISPISVHSEENHEVAIDQIMIECSLFQTRETHSDALHRIRSSVLSHVIGQFASELEGTTGELRDGHLVELFKCAKVSF
jgi:hypothetical protein